LQVRRYVGQAKHISTPATKFQKWSKGSLMARIDGGQIVTKDELAQLLGVSDTVVMNYIRAGCPVVRKGGPGISYQLDTSQVFAWVREREALGRGRATADPAKTEAEEGRRRSSLATAQLKEFELAQKLGQTVYVDEVKVLLEDQLAHVRQRLLAMPGRIAAEVAALQDEGAVERLIADEVREALTELTLDQVDYADAA
jgi:phage terminase Nu1 subunit (DNA packaging protein)